ncbi:hypothetical protein OESDEN_15188 [Oesophagostomum dentatum]|uniref:Uncharacterized protein n=1 Tax=Oesophagostomum dentatum TaxID=61180 RepID=A0A0B1SMI7_OESDE|nr:hypothetical protein OESDEN_15188 [Oesophagostomum dentatum]
MCRGDFGLTTALRSGWLLVPHTAPPRCPSSRAATISRAFSLWRFAYPLVVAPLHRTAPPDSRLLQPCASSHLLS